MTRKHAAGPWIIDRTMATGPMNIVSETEEEAVSIVCSFPDQIKKWNGRERIEADARLIAAAPCLLEACEAAVRFAVRAINENIDIPGFSPEDHILVKQLRAAIAKATVEAHP